MLATGGFRFQARRGCDDQNNIRAEHQSCEPTHTDKLGGACFPQVEDVGVISNLEAAGPAGTVGNIGFDINDSEV